MKNRVLRLALVVVLVMALVLTLVACGDTDTVVSPTPTSTPTTTPTATPTATPTVTPTVGPEIDTLSEEFKVILTPTDGVYGTNISVLKDLPTGGDLADPTKTLPFYGKFVLDLGVFQKAAAEADAKLGNVNSALEYNMVVSVGGTALDLSMDGTGAGAAIKLGKITLDYDGDAAAAPEVKYFVHNNQIVFLLETAGEYNLPIDVVINDTYTDFGGWNNNEREPQEFSVEATATVAKADKVLKVNPVAISENTTTSGEISIAADGKVMATVTGGTATQIPGTPSFVAPTGVESIAGSTETLNFVFDLGYLAYAKPGDYPVTIKVYNGTPQAGEANLIENVADETFVNFNYTIENTTLHVLTYFEVNQIRDVVTSATEIKYETRATDDGVYVNGFLGDPADPKTTNIKTQHPLAIQRYEALTAGQKSFFVNGTVALFGGADYAETDINDTYIALWAADQVPAVPAADIVKGDVIKKYLDAATAMVEKLNVIDAFEKKFDDEKHPLLEITVDYTAPADPDPALTVFTAADPTLFNIKNLAHVTSYNNVKAYYDSLSAEDKEVIDSTIQLPAADGEATIFSQKIASYKYASSLFGLEEVKAVQEAIIGAYNAYVKANLNNAKIYYTETDTPTSNVVSWPYINSAEVKQFTATAETLYNALSAAQKAMLGVDTARAGKVDAGTGGNPPLKAIEIKVDGNLEMILKQLILMNKKINQVIEISEYVNINDFSDSKIAFERLNSLIFGTTPDGATASLFFNSTSDGGDRAAAGNVVAGRKSYAMLDIVNSQDRKVEEVVAEYKAWIDYIIAVEEYKKSIIAEIDELIIGEFPADSEDYSKTELATAVSKDSAQYKEMVRVIMEETKFLVDGTTASPYAAQIVNIIDQTQLNYANLETVADASDLITDNLDADGIFQIYVAQIDLITP